MFEFRLTSSALILTLLVGLPSLVQAAHSNVQLESCKESLRSQVENNRFIRNRNLKEYEEKLGFEFSSRLTNLTRGDHWIDSGVGRGIAVKEYWFRRSLDDRPRVTGIGRMRENLFSFPGLEFLTGRFLEDIPLSEIGPATLISDYNGPMLYSEDISQILQIYVDLITPVEGAIFIRWRGIEQSTQVDHGSAEKWLKTIQGLVVTGITTTSHTPTRTTPHDVLLVQKLRRNVVIPKLSLVETISVPSKSGKIRPYLERRFLSIAHEPRK